ncbi:MAG TPA: RNA pyrophosphohydrolase, partial [Stellaceae bacterium]|nr:RNA pyrophosphohydrolase [Stellaceae bacterium]
YRPGVGILLLNPEGRIFIGRRILRASEDGVGEAWQMPQGGIDRGETPREAALREMKEEIGTNAAEIIAESRRWLHYDLPPEVAKRVWGGRFRGQSQKWFLMRFMGRDSEIDLMTHHPEFDAWKWVGAEALPRLIVPFKRQLYLDILDEFANHLKLPPR